MAVKELTPELKKILAGALPFDSEAKFTHELKLFKNLIKDYAKKGVDIDEKLTPKFTFKSFENEQEDSVLNLITKFFKLDYSDRKAYKKLINKASELVKDVLVDWEIVDLGTGNYIEFDKNKLDRFPASYIHELFNQIARVSGLIEAEQPEIDKAIKEGL